MTFRGSADATPTRCVTVHESGRVLRTLRLRLDLCNHSPTGFGWGYRGSGPAQLALAILAEATDDATAMRLHQQFKEDQVATLPMDRDWEIAREDVLSWVADQPPRRARKASSTGAMACLALGLGLALAGPALADPPLNLPRVQEELIGDALRECKARADHQVRELHARTPQLLGGNTTADLRWTFYAQCAAPTEGIARQLMDDVELGRVSVGKFRACRQRTTASDDWNRPDMSSRVWQCSHSGS